MPETAQAMIGYAVRRLREALWTRVRSKVRLIWCVNAIRTNAGYETLGNSYDEQSSARFSQGVGATDQSLGVTGTLCRLPRSTSLRGMIGIARSAGRVGSTTSVANGSGGSVADGGVRHSAPAVYGDSSDTPAATAVDVYDVAMEDVPLPSLVMPDETAGADDSTASTSAKRSYLEQEARHVASITSLAAFAAQQTAARVDGLAREIEGVGK